MKLVREHINEKFTEDSDPIHDLGIGGMCAAGSILRTKREVPCIKDEPYCCISKDDKSTGSYMIADSLWFVISVLSRKKDFMIRLKAMQNLKHAKLYAKYERNDSYPDWVPFNIKLSYNELKKYFEIVST
jgi:hypothetical protein